MYRVTTWDWETKEFTPQRGAPEFCETKWDVKRALYRLRELGYETYRGAMSVSVRKVDEVVAPST